MALPRWIAPALVSACVLLGGLFAWSSLRHNALEDEMIVMREALSQADSLAQDAADARWYAERQRDKSDEVLNELYRAYPELERRAAEIEKEKNEALINLVEARRQEQAKQVALEGERTARVDEEAQRHIAEARADSIAREKRISDNLRMRQRASVLAQNSLLVKGRPEFRGLMAVHALHSMEQSAGDMNKAELVRALRTALEEMERASPMRLSGFKRPPHQLIPEKHKRRFLSLGHDGVVYRVDMEAMKTSVFGDHSRLLEAGTGRSFLTTDNSFVILTDPRGGLAAYPAAGGALIARSTSGSTTESVRALAAWPDLSQVVTGDARGNVHIWRKAGNKFELQESKSLGAAVKGMAFDASTGHVVVAASTGPLLLLMSDGSGKPIALPTNQNARCIASAGDGIVVVGTENGSILQLDIRSERVSVLHPGSGRSIETITATPGAARVATVNSVKELVVFSKATDQPPVRMELDAIPAAMSLGMEDELYLAFGDRIERILCSSRSMAARLCDLIGRTWTASEWKEIGETGQPVPTCTGF